MMKKTADLKESLSFLTIIDNDKEIEKKASSKKFAVFQIFCFGFFFIGIGSSVTYFMVTDTSNYQLSQKSASNSDALPSDDASNREGTGALSVSGYIVAKKKTTVSADATGRLIKLFVKEGQHVKAGETLAQLANEVEKTRLELTHSQVLSAIAQLQKNQLDYEQQVSVHKRNVDLRQAGMISIAALEQSKGQLDILGNQLALGRLDIVQSNLNEQLAETAYKNTLVVSPYSGIVLALNAQIGEIVSPVGGSGFTRSGICTIADPESQVVEFDISEKFIGQIRLGQSLKAVLDAYPDIPLKINVTEIASEVDRAKGTVKIRAALESIDSRFRPDMGVRISITKS